MTKIKVFFLTIFIVLSAYSATIVYNTMICDIPRFQNSEIWLKPLYTVKDFINSKPTTKQRLLIISGSNSLFGFDGALIDSQTRFEPINYGTHAGLPISFHIDKIIEQANEGDIIFMPLEFIYYTRNEPNEDYWYIQNMLTWNKTYTKYIVTQNTILAYIKNNPMIMLKNFFKSFIHPMHISENPIATIQTKWQSHQEFEGYEYTSLNQYGDFCTQVGSFYTNNTQYLSPNLTLSSFFLSEYTRLLEFAKSKNIKVFLTYPVTLENPEFSLNDPTTFAKIENLKAQLKAHNIDIYGDFRDFHFERKYFFDTASHLNSEGAILRTQAFIKLLEQMQAQGLL